MSRANLIGLLVLLLGLGIVFSLILFKTGDGEPPTPADTTDAVPPASGTIDPLDESATPDPQADLDPLGSRAPDRSARAAEPPAGSDPDRNEGLDADVAPPHVAGRPAESAGRPQGGRSATTTGAGSAATSGAGAAPSSSEAKTEQPGVTVTGVAGSGAPAVGTSAKSAPADSAPPAGTPPVENRPPATRSDDRPAEAVEEPVEAPREPEFRTTALIRLSPTPSDTLVGGQIVVSVDITEAQDVGHVPFHLLYDPEVLRFQHGSEGSFLSSSGAQTAFFAVVGSRGGSVIVGLSQLGQGMGVDGRGNLCTLTFEAVGQGETTLTFSHANANDASGDVVPAIFDSAVVRVR